MSARNGQTCLSWGNRSWGFYLERCLKIPSLAFTTWASPEAEHCAPWAPETKLTSNPNGFWPKVELGPHLACDCCSCCPGGGVTLLRLLWGSRMLFYPIVFALPKAIVCCHISLFLTFPKPFLGSNLPEKLEWNFNYTGSCLTGLDSITFPSDPFVILSAM
jgi:hypothetical protein